MNSQKDYAASFAKELKRLRENKGFTQRKLGSIIGVASTYINNIESKTSTHPSNAENIEKIAKALDCNLDELLAKAGKISPDIIDIIINNAMGITDLLRDIAAFESGELEGVHWNKYFIIVRKRTEKEALDYFKRRRQ